MFVLGQIEVVARAFDPLPQAGLQLRVLVGMPGIEGKVHLLEGIFVEVEHEPRLPFQCDVFPAVASHDASPRPVDGIGLPCGNDQLEKGGAGFLRDRGVVEKSPGNIPALHPFRRGDARANPVEPKK